MASEISIQGLALLQPKTIPKPFITKKKKNPNTMSLTLFTATITATPNTQQKSKLRRSIPSAFIPKRSPYTSCSQNQHSDQGDASIDRRNVLIGLGTLYGASPMLGNAAFAADCTGGPILAPDLKDCNPAYDPQKGEYFQCCKPDTSNPIPFKLPSSSEPLRTRISADKMKDADIAKFKEAITRMKNLDANDPRSFYQQAQIHCAFCNNSYREPNHPDLPIEIHGSWLFPPWHRFYVYFWEKILGSLMEDPTFAIPYWNWAAPYGMRMPEIYIKPSDAKNPLYNPNRNLNHYDALFDYTYKYGDPNPAPSQEQQIIMKNLSILNNDYRESKNAPTLFMGRTLCAGEGVTEQYGSLETIHNTVHQWVGPDTSPYWDMGNLHTAARDTIFYGHHGNVDRLWYVYQKYRGKVEFDTPNWLDATFVFPDETGQIVTCKLSDSLDPLKLRYTYDSVEPGEQPFFLPQKKKSTAMKSTVPLTTVAAFGTNPRTFSTTLRALVDRPKVSRTKNEKEAAVEVLVLDDITYKGEERARLDVYIAKPTADGKVSSDLGELVGSFVKISHGKRLKSVKKFGITKLLEDIDADESSNLVVSLVPNIELTVGAVSLELLQTS